MCVVRGNVVCGARSAHVTGVAEEMGVQGEALRAGLIGELLAALLRKDKADKGTGMYTEEVRLAFKNTFGTICSSEFSVYASGL